MITDIEMGAMNGLLWLCQDRISKDILEVATDMLGAMDVDAHDNMSDEEQTAFLQEYADEINNLVKNAVMNDGLPKKKIGDWEVIASFVYGDKEIFIGENPRPEKEVDRYLVGGIIANGLFEQYVDCLSGDNYSEIAELYSMRIQEQIQLVKEELAKFPYDRSIIGNDSCDSIRDRDIRGEIIVIDSRAIKREYAGADRQLWVAESGFGCSPNGSGRKVFCKNIFTGDSGTWLRQDVLGTIKPECVPQWVKDRMTDKPIEVVFTFGSSMNYPFQWGYVSITAPTVQEACAEFRRNWPDRTPGFINCADYYYEEADVADIKATGNGGKCHKSIDITIPVIEGKSVDAVLSDATERSVGAGSKGQERDISLE